jgi:hypothetical protein
VCAQKEPLPAQYNYYLKENTPYCLSFFFRDNYTYLSNKIITLGDVKSRSGDALHSPL